MKKRIFSIILVFYLVASNTTYVYAEAATATLAVTGTIATGGLSASALVPYALPVVGGVLLGAGINVYLTNASEQAGMTKSQFIKSKISSYCDAARTTAGDFAKKILDGARIARDGTIQLTDQACSQINQFVNWLKSNDDVANVGSGTSGTVTLGPYNCPYVNSLEANGKTNDNNDYYIKMASEKNLAVILSQNKQTIWFISNESFSIGFYIGYQANGTLHTSNSYSRLGYYCYGHSDYDIQNINFPIDIPVANTNNLNALLDSFNGTFNPGQSMDNPANDTFTGTQDALQGLGNILNPAPDKTTVLNPGLTGSLDIPGVQNPTIDVGDYLDALTRVLDNAGTLDLPVTDPATGTIENTRVTPTTYEPTIDKVDNPDLPDPTITNPAINPDDDGDPVQMAKPLAIQFKGVFPFCIPFDVKDMIGLLNATPEAPSYHVHWYIPFADTYLDFTVDLSAWNSTAAICRQMELLLFCLGLAFVTRSMFIRG